MDLIYIGLATWRLAHLITEENGPFGVFTKIREMFGIQHYEDGEIYLIPETKMAELFTCMYCMSVWVAALHVALWYYFPEYTFLYLLLMSASSFAILLDKMHTKMLS